MQGGSPSSFGNFHVPSTDASHAPHRLTPSVLASSSPVLSISPPPPSHSAMAPATDSAYGASYVSSYAMPSQHVVDEHGTLEPITRTRNDGEAVTSVNLRKQVETRQVHEDAARLSHDSDFMCFFYQHVAQCPPHGPFRHYAALTFLMRARERYGPKGLESSKVLNGSRGQLSVLSAREGRDNEGEYFASLHAKEFFASIHLESIMMLINSRFSTSHLANWPLYYVPAVVSSADVAGLLQQQQKE